MAAAASSLPAPGIGALEATTWPAPIKIAWASPQSVPPENKPVGAEVKACRPFLISEFDAMAELRVILALGGLAHNATLATLGYKQSAFKFGHCAQHEIAQNERPILLMNSYHCSRYNTNTGRLTTPMFEDVFTAIRGYLDTL